MNQYITGNTIKSLREKQKMTQAELAQLLCVSDKTISKWETGRGYPDICFLEPLAKTLKVSIIELLSGNKITNQNTSANLKKSCFYTCPICGNVIFSLGDALVSCCGIQLLPLEAELPTDDFLAQHKITIQNVEDEFFVTLDHPMTKTHHISWISCVGPDSVEIKKLYPEQNPQARFSHRGHSHFFVYCNNHGLFRF